MREIHVAESLNDLSDRKQHVIARQMDIPTGDHSWSWVPTIEISEYRAIVGMRNMGEYGTAQRKVPEGTMMGSRHVYYELICWRTPR